MSEPMNMQKVVERLTYFTTYYIYTSELKEVILYLKNEMKSEMDKVSKIREYLDERYKSINNSYKTDFIASISHYTALEISDAIDFIDSLEDK